MGSPEDTNMPVAYVSYRSLQTFLSDMRDNGIVARVDNSVLTRFSGSIAKQLKYALRCLGLVDENYSTTDKLRNLVEHYETDNYAEALYPVLADAYPFLESLDLTTATLTMFSDAFRTHTNAREGVLPKALRFYLQAAQDAGIEIGPRLRNAKIPNPKPSGKTTKTEGRILKRKEKSAGESTKGEAQHENNGGSEEEKGDTGTDKTIRQALLDKFPDFDPEWSPEVQASWFDGYNRLLKMDKE